jgi:hypothetical protein
MRMRGWSAAVVMMLCACAGHTPDADIPVATATSRATVAPQTSIDITRRDEAATVNIPAARAAVWQAMLATHASLQIPISAADERAGTAEFTLRDKSRTLLGKPASAYVDCGNGPAGPRADSYRLTLKVTHTLQSLGDKQTLVNTLIEAWARHPGQSADAIQCNSRGTLEKQIAGIITTRATQ